MTNGAQIVHRLAHWSGFRPGRAGEISFPAIAGAPAADPKLAVVGRLARRKVIFVDGDLRRPSIVHGTAAGAPAFPYQRCDIRDHELRHP